MTLTTHVSFFLHLKSRETVLFSWQHTASPARARLIPPPSIHPRLFVVPNFDAGWIPIYPVSRRFPTVFFLPIFFHKALRFSFISGKIPRTSRNDPRTCHRRMLWNWAGHQMPFIFTWLSVCITQFRLDMNHNDIFFFCLYVENAVCLHLIYTATDKLVFPCSYFENKTPLISH